MTGDGQFLAETLAHLDIDHGLDIDEGSAHAHWCQLAAAAVDRAVEPSCADASAKNAAVPDDDAHEII